MNDVGSLEVEFFIRWILCFEFEIRKGLNLENFQLKDGEAIDFFICSFGRGFDLCLLRDSFLQ